MQNSEPFTEGEALRVRPLPMVLVAAQARARHPLHVLDLGRPGSLARRVLEGILVFVSARAPSKAIWPWRETLLKEARVGCERSLYAGLKTLDEKGYIARSQRRRAQRGTFHISEIRLTDKAVALLGLSAANAAAATPAARSKAVIHSPPSAKAADGQYVERATTAAPSEQLSSRGHRSGGSRQGRSAENRVPADLQRLLALGISPARIFECMGVAKRALGYRLADVVEALWGGLGLLRGDQAYALLKWGAMNTERDWSRAAARARQRREQLDAPARIERAVVRLWKLLDGAELIDAAGATATFSVVEGLVVLKGAGSRIPGGRAAPNLTLARRIAAGEWRVVALAAAREQAADIVRDATAQVAEFERLLELVRSAPLGLRQPRPLAPEPTVPSMQGGADAREQPKAVTVQCLAGMADCIEALDARAAIAVCARFARTYHGWKILLGKGVRARVDQEHADLVEEARGQNGGARFALDRRRLVAILRDVRFAATGTHDLTGAPLGLRIGEGGRYEFVASESAGQAGIRALSAARTALLARAASVA